MKTATIEALIYAIRALVDDDGGETWQQKAEQVRDVVKNNDCETPFAEFISWFESEEA